MDVSLLRHLANHGVDVVEDRPQCDVAGWLPLLSQTQAAIEAVEAAMRESLTL